MKRLTLTCGLLALLAIAPAARADLGVDAQLGTRLYDKYVFRGAQLSKASLMSYARGSYDLMQNLALQAGVWNTTGLSDPRPGTGIAGNETRLGAQLVWQPLRLFSVTGGYVNYQRSNQVAGRGVPDTQEGYLGLDFNLPWSPGVYAFYDFDNNVGTYLMARAGKSVRFQNGWMLDLDGHAGFDLGKRLSTDSFSFQDGRVSGVLSYEIMPGLTMGPGLDIIVQEGSADPGEDHVRHAVNFGFDYSTSF